MSENLEVGFDTPVPRRRSAFFDRRRSSFGLLNAESNQLQKDEEEFKELLKTEKSEWRRLRRLKKEEREQVLNLAKEPITIDILTTEQKEHLSQRPDSTKIMNKYRQLINLQNENIKLFNKYVEKEEIKCCKLQTRVHNVTEDVISKLK